MDNYDYDNNLKNIIKNNDIKSFDLYVFKKNNFLYLIDLIKTIYIPISPLGDIIFYDSIDIFKLIINYINKEHFNKSILQKILNYIFCCGKSKVISYLLDEYNIDINSYNIEELINNLILSKDKNRLEIFLTKYKVKIDNDKFLYLCIEHNIQWITLFLLKYKVPIRNYLNIINLLIIHNDYESLDYLFKSYKEASNIIYVFHNKIEISTNKLCNIILYNNDFNFNKLNNNYINMKSPLFKVIKYKHYVLLQKIINEIYKNDLL